jgi:hypothetical protein
MSNGKWLLAQQNEGAKGCFLLGRLGEKAGLKDFSTYRDTIWFVDAEGSSMCLPKPPNIILASLESIGKEQLDDIIRSMLQGDPGALPDIFCSQGILERDSASYEYILGRIHLHCDETLRARKTRQEEGFKAQINILENLKAYTTNRFSDQNTGILRNQPVAVVGAGPSLDASVHLIAKHRESMHVFAADSALATLRANKIEPDATFTVDAEKHAWECVCEGQRPGILFMSSKSPADWLETEAEDHIFLSGNNLTEDWLQEQGVCKTKLAVLGNCGITAVNVAYFLGCSPILLFGMDHASDSTGSGHAKAVNLDVSRGKSHNPSQRTTKVPGNYTDQVPTFLYNEWEKLDRLIYSAAGSQAVWNVTDRGAKFSNAKLIHPIDFEKQWGGMTISRTSPVALRKESEAPLNLMLKIQDLVEGERALLEEISKLFGGNDEKVRCLLSSLFGHKDLSRLLGSLSMRVIPHLLQWNKVPDEEKKAIYKEGRKTAAMLLKLFGKPQDH